MNELPAETNIQDYPEQLGNEWGLGIAGINNGLVMLLSKKDREIRISPGEGTQKFVSDEFLKNLMDFTMVPKFKQDKFYKGNWVGLIEFMEELEKSNNRKK